MTSCWNGYLVIVTFSLHPLPRLPKSCFFTPKLINYNEPNNGLSTEPVAHPLQRQITVIVDSCCKNTDFGVDNKVMSYIAQRVYNGES